jgi:hypothetical protein
MKPRRFGMRWRLAASIAAGVGVAPGCSTVLDSGRYHAVAGADSDSGAATGGQASAFGDAATDGANCNVDLTAQCYPCTATTPVQLLNACTSASCVPFDDTTRLANLLPDGALPPLPLGGPGDGG